MSRVAELPCCVCGSHEVQVHHLIGRNLRGMSQKSPDWLTIPLCFTHHSLIHSNGWRDWEMTHGSQIDYLARTLEKLYDQ